MPSGPHKRGRSGSPNALNYPMCQVVECRENLTNAKDYYRRHNVCEIHSKAVNALVREQAQRFCQQCSRFHLSEFDEGKRSGRCRLAGHNKRRRKTQPTGYNTSPRPSIPGNNGNSENHSNLDIVNLLAVLASPRGINNEGRSANRPLVPHNDKIIEVFSKMKTLPLADEKSPSSGRDFKDCNMSSPSTLDLLAPLSATPPALAMDIESQQSGSYQCSGDTDFHHVPETCGPHLPLQLFTSQTEGEEDDSPPRLSVSGKYFSSESSNPSGEMSPSSSPPALCNIFPIPVSNASSKEEHTRENTNNFNASKTIDCFKLFGRSINGTDVVSSTQSPLAYRTGYTSSSGSDHSASSMSSDPQDQTGHIILKLLDKNPSHLPGTLRTQINSWLSNIPSEMESYIRPGCIFISLCLIPRFVWEHVEEHLCQYTDALVKDVDPQFWVCGRFLIRSHKKMALHRNGNVRVCKLWRKGKSPELICVSPLTIIGGQEMCFTLKGRNLNCPNIKINCTHASDYTIRSVPSPAGQDTAHDEIILGNFVVHDTSPNQLGCCFIEVENGLGGTTFPVIVSDSAAVCEELRRLESEICQLPKTVFEQGNQIFVMATGSREVTNFLNEIGCLFQRKHNSSTFDFKISRFKFLLIFLVERDFVEVVNTRLDTLLEITLARNASKESLEMVSELHILSRAVKRKCLKMVDLLIHYAICHGNTSVHYIFTPNVTSPLHLAASTGGRMNFQILVNIMEEPGIFFAFGSSENYGRASQPRLNLKHLYFRDILYCNGLAVPIKPLPYILDSPGEARFMRVNGRKEQGDWSSLPALPLLMIMDRLDVFDNKRLTSVCRDWQSTSMQYPKNMYSVGDGVPWIWHVKYGKESHTREFISVPRNRKFLVDMPEFAHSELLFSKGGWILLHQKGGIGKAGFPTCLFLVNPFTRDKIELPKIEGNNNIRCYGSFTLCNSDGYPNRVILIVPELPFQASIHTTCTGDQVWTSHNYIGLERTFLTNFTHVVIGDNVYCLDRYGYITILNVANNSMKVLPPIPLGGFIAEHGGELIYVEHGENVVRKYKSFVLVHKFKEASSSWERLSRDAVMGTSWYVCNGLNVVAVKGRGLKIYKLLQIIERSRSGIRACYKCTHYYVCVSNLLTGKVRRLRVLVPDHKFLLWVAIG